MPKTPEELLEKGFEEYIEEYLLKMDMLRAVLMITTKNMPWIPNSYLNS